MKIWKILGLSRLNDDFRLISFAAINAYLSPTLVLYKKKLINQLRKKSIYFYIYMARLSKLYIIYNYSRV